MKQSKIAKLTILLTSLIIVIGIYVYTESYRVLKLIILRIRWRR